MSNQNRLPSNQFKHLKLNVKVAKSVKFSDVDKVQIISPNPPKDQHSKVNLMHVLSHIEGKMEIDKKELDKVKVTIEKPFANMVIYEKPQISNLFNSKKSKEVHKIIVTTVEPLKHSDGNTDEKPKYKPSGIVYERHHVSDLSQQEHTKNHPEPIIIGPKFSSEGSNQYKSETDLIKEFQKHQNKENVIKSIHFDKDHHPLLSDNNQHSVSRGGILKERIHPFHETIIREDTSKETPLNGNIIQCGLSKVKTFFQSPSSKPTHTQETHNAQPLNNHHIGSMTLDFSKEHSKKFYFHNNDKDNHESKILHDYRIDHGSDRNLKSQQMKAHINKLNSDIVRDLSQDRHHLPTLNSENKIEVHFDSKHLESQKDFVDIKHFDFGRFIHHTNEPVVFIDSTHCASNKLFVDHLHKDFTSTDHHFQTGKETSHEHHNIQMDKDDHHHKHFFGDLTNEHNDSLHHHKTDDYQSKHHVNDNYHYIDHHFNNDTHEKITHNWHSVSNSGKDHLL